MFRQMIYKVEVISLHLIPHLAAEVVHKGISCGREKAYETLKKYNALTSLCRLFENKSIRSVNNERYIKKIEGMRFNLIPNIVG